MRSANVAEWILSLVTTPDRAAATVGDLVESRAGALRCWSAVGSHVFRSLTGRAYSLAIGAFLAQFIIVAIPLLAIAYVRPAPAVFLWVARLACLATQVVVGRWIALHGRAQALGICLIVVIIDCALGAMAGLRLNNASINMAIWAIPLLASTLLARSGKGKAPVRHA